MRRATCSRAPARRASIYKIAPDGKGTPFYETKATHATALAFDTAGNLLVGTGSPGRVLRIDPDGKAFVLLDSPFQEIRALRFDDKGALYVAALSGRDRAAAPRRARRRPRTPATPEAGRAPVPSVTAEVTSFAVVDVRAAAAADAASGRDDRRTPKGADLPHRARRALGSALGVARRRALRSHVRRRTAR